MFKLRKVNLKPDLSYVGYHKAQSLAPYYSSYLLMTYHSAALLVKLEYLLMIQPSSFIVTLLKTSLKLQVSL